MKNIIGQVVQIEGQDCVVVKQSRHRLELKCVESPLHSRRLQLKLTQQEMTKCLGISQTQYSRIEAGLLECPSEIMAAVNAMLAAKGIAS